MKPAARYSRHAWLAAAVPVCARRVRVDDPELAATLAAAGAEIVDAGEADVEIVSLADRASAAQVIVTLDHGPQGAQRRDTEALPVKTARRLAASAAARTEAHRALLTLARRGFRTRSFLWDLEQPLRSAGGKRQLRPVERFPRAALVLGVRGAPTPTTLEAIAAEAAVAAGELAWSLPLVQESRLVVLGGPGVLRVSVGPGAHTIECQERRIRELRSLLLSPVVDGRLPAILAGGSTGLARWTLEQRLPGRQPAAPLTKPLLEQCLELLVELHALGGSERRDLRQDAATVADACPAGEAAAVRRLGERLRESLRGVRRGFGHGDFWRGNLLARDGTLSGVIDWEDACAGQLPLLDLFHLELTADRTLAPAQWGAAITDRLLPAARAGGSELMRGYCQRTGVDAAPELLVDLTFAYWLERAAIELGSFADRRLRTAWMDENVVRVLDAAAALAV